MKFSARVENLADILKQCCRIASDKTGEMSGHLLLSAREGQLDVTAHNGQQHMTLHFQELEVVEAGAICIAARKFEQIVCSLPGEKVVTVTVGEDKAAVTCGRSRFSIATLPASSFPQALLPEDRTQKVLSIDAQALREGIRRIAFCVARRDVRTYLNGMLFDAVAGKLTLVGTDGHRMGTAEMQVATANNLKFTLPVACLEDVASFASDGVVEIQYSGNLVAFIAAHGTLTSRLIEGKFPNYSDLITRAEQGHPIKMSRDAITSAVARVSLLSDGKSQAVKLKFAQQTVEVLSVSNGVSKVEEAEDLLPCDLNSDAFELGLNSRYAQEVFRAVETNELQLFYSGPASGTLIMAKDCPHQKFVLMPVRL
ncbi:TPA: DNA polymerase III subunit beta [Pseudomonas aeruginosa]